MSWGRLQDARGRPEGSLGADGGPPCHGVEEEASSSENASTASCRKLGLSRVKRARGTEDVEVAIKRR